MNGQLGTLFYKLVLGEEDFNKSLGSAEKRIEDFNKKLTSVGKELNTKLTLPILAIGAATIKFAADAEVSAKKFETAFKGSMVDAANAVKTLNTQYGISNTQSTKLLANTGDLLKGFGASADAALKMSLETQKLAAALGAYNGVPVAESSAAITKALLGETEGLKSLGVAIKQTDIEQELMRKGQEKLTGQALLVAKAQATMTLITQQSGDAIASLAENQDTAAFQTQALLGDMKDLGVEMGQVLLPIAKDIVGGVRDVVAWFSDLSETSKTTIVTIAALAAGIGPVVTGIGAVSTALTFLAANPIGLAIAGIAALTLGVVALANALNERAIDKALGRFGELAAEIGVTGDQIVQIEKSLKGWNTVNIEGVQEWADRLGITKEQFLQVAVASEKVTDKYKESAQILLDQYATEKALKEEIERKAIAQAEVARSAEEAARAAEAALKAAKEEQEARINQKYLDLREKVVSIQLDALTEQERIQLRINELEANKWAKGSQLEADRLEAVEILRQKIEQLNKEETERAEAAAVRSQEAAEREAKRLQDEADKKIAEQKRADDYKKEIEGASLQRLFEMQATELQLLDQKFQAEVANAQKLGIDTTAIEQYYAEQRKKIADKEAAEKDKRAKEDIERVRATMEATFAAIDTAMNASASNWEDTADALADQFLAAAAKSGNAYVIAAAVAVKAITSIIKMVKDLNNAEEAKKKLIAKVEAEITAIKMNAQKDRIKREYDNEIKLIDRLEKKRLDEYLATLSKKEINALRSAGVISETELERIEREKEAAIAAGDQEALALLEREEKIATIRSEAEAQRLEAEKKYKNQMAKWEYDKAVNDKEAKIVEIYAQHQEALAGLKWWQWLAGWDDDVTAVYQKLLNTVSSLRIPSPVYLAKGGIVPATPGGVNAVVAEAGYDEFVAPLNDRTYNALGSAIVDSMTGSSTGPALGGGLMNLTIVLDGLGQVALQLTQDALDSGILHIPSRIITR